MVKVFEGPVQLRDALLNVGVTVTVATTGDVPLLTVEKAAMVDPVPLAARPIEVVLFVQA